MVFIVIKWARHLFVGADTYPKGTGSGSRSRRWASPGPARRGRRALRLVSIPGAIHPASVVDAAAFGRFVKRPYGGICLLVPFTLPECLLLPGLGGAEPRPYDAIPAYSRRAAAIKNDNNFPQGYGNTAAVTV